MRTKLIVGSLLALSALSASAALLDSVNMALFNHLGDPERTFC